MLEMRLNALAIVGRYVGKSAMIQQIKEDEIKAFYEWIGLGYANTHCLDQKRENEIWQRRSEIVMLGKEYMEEIYEYCRERVLKAE